MDLGQKQDYTAVAIIEEPVWVEQWMTNHKWAYRLGVGELAGTRKPGWASPAEISPSALEEVLSLNYHEGKPAGAPLSLRHLERFALGTPYPVIVERVRDMLASPPLFDRRVAFVVDATGVGAGVVDQFVQAGLSPIPVWITGGDRVNRSPDGSYRVPKRDLVAAVQVLMQNERLKIARALPEAATLRQELRNFRVRIDPKTAHDSYSHWREAEHDDLVLATALAAWFRQYWNAHLDVANATAPRR